MTGIKDDDEFNETMQDVLRSPDGAMSGFAGFIYHSDTCKFSRDNMKTIWRHVVDQSADFGEDPLTMVSNFNCLSGLNIPPFEIAAIVHNDPDTATINDGIDTQVLNALAWYTLEEVANYIAAD